MTTKRYPFDYETMYKGMVITQQEIEAIIQFRQRQAPEKYNLKRLQLARAIEEGIWYAQELVVTVRCLGADIRILTDEEAAEHNRRRFMEQMRGAKRTHMRNLGVDRTVLSPEQNQRHERTLEVQGKTLQAIQTAMPRMLIARPYQRQVPGKQG